MKTDPQRYVAHIDILGFRALNGRDPRQAWSTLSALGGALTESTSVTIISDKIDTPIHVPEIIKAVLFSDTIVLYSASDTPRDFHAIFTAVLNLFSKALHYSVPIRCGVSKGTFFVDEARSMYAGPALIEAYDMGEASQWLGVVLSESVAKDGVTQDLRSGATRMVVEWAVPTKNGPVQAFAANWPIALKNSFRIRPPLTARILYSVFEKFHGPIEELPEKVFVKYSNTIDFINEQFALHEKSK